LVFRLAKLRRTFYAQIERASFRTASVDGGLSLIVPKSAAVGGKPTFRRRRWGIATERSPRTVAMRRVLETELCGKLRELPDVRVSSVLHL